MQLRKKHGLSREEMAEKLFVTRQAISRWENGETVPNTDTLKIISRVFGVSINELLGEPRNNTCQVRGHRWMIEVTAVSLTVRYMIPVVNGAI